MWKWIRSQVLEIPVLRDWVVSIEDSRAHRKLRKEYVPQIEKARSEKRDLDAQNLYAEWHHYQDQIDQPTYVTASDRLVAKARRLHVAVPDKPSRYDEMKNDDWFFADATGDWALRYPTYERLQREVQAAQRAANDEWRKWATLLLALAGFGLGWASFRAKTKQPDPCQRNYYRNDAGACVFALSPSPVTRPAPVLDKPIPPKKKSSPAKSSRKQVSAPK